MKTKMANIPIELIEQILLNLPVKSLKRFRLVSKPWRSLIDTQTFTNTHLKKQTLSKRRRLILGGSGLFTIDLNTPVKAAHVIKPPFPYQPIDGVSNSCDGLVLILSEPPVLWNPFTSEYRFLPGVCAQYPAPVSCYSKTVYGFAYDSVTDDYKVVRAVEYCHLITHNWVSTRTEIYLLKSGKWREIEDFEYPLPFIRNWRVHVNGALHTLVIEEDEDEGCLKGRIMAFSVETEKHSEFKMPVGITEDVDDLVLDMVNGCLCLINPTGKRISVWVMKEYGVGESWKKVLTIRPPNIYPYDTLKALVYSDDGKKVLLNHDDKRLVWYDLRKKTVECVPVKGLPSLFYAEVCVESLVSVKEENGGGKRKVGSGDKKGKKKRDDFLSEGFKLRL